MQKMEVGVCREAVTPPTVWHLLFLLSGVYSLLLLLPSVSGLVFSPGWIYLCAGVVCVLLWAARRVGWQWAMLCALLLTLVWMIDCLLLWDTVCAQIRQTARYVSGTVRTVAFTETAFLLAALIALLFFTLEFFLESHIIPYVLTSVLVLIGPVTGVRPSVEAVTLGLIFQMSFWTIHETGLRQTRSDFALPNRARLTSLTGGIMAAILLLTLLASIPLSLNRADDVYAPIYEAEGLVRRTVNHLGGFDSQPVTGGTISRGNRYDTGAAHLFLTADRKPSQPIYLRGFAGEEYVGGDWTRAGDDAIFKRMAERLVMNPENVRIPASENTSDRVSLIARTWYTMYYALNNQSRRDDPPEPVSIRVRQANGENRTFYTPYYSYGSGVSDDHSYAFTFYEQRDMDIHWDALPEQLNVNWYRWVQSAYAQECRRIYTQVPRKLLPRLTRLYQDNPLDDLDEITAFILNTLHSYASYSLTPGWTPLNEEVVEYFLFDNGLGYCQHFAAAATLLYRLYGIPARYATGYIARPDDFTSYNYLRALLSDTVLPAGTPDDAYSDGTADDAYSGGTPGSVYDISGDIIPTEYDVWQATLSDASAHAWVEIWLDDYGWTPVEVTPAADGQTPEIYYPGMKNETLSELLNGLQFDLPKLSGRSGNTLIPRTPESLIAAGAARADEISRQKLHTVVTVLGIAALWAVPGGLYFLRRRRLRQWADASCREVFGRLLSMLRFAGILRECDGLESDFAQRLSENLPGISGETAETFYRTVQSAAYGPDAPSDEMNAFARSVRTRAARILYERVPWWKKPLFRYAYGE